MWYESPNSPRRARRLSMPKKRHKPEQVIGKLRDADAMLAGGKTIGQVCQSLEVSEQTFHRWRAQYGGMKAEEAKRLKHLEEENKRLKKLLAEAELDKAILKEALQGNF
jgi:putative transposase